MRAILIDMPHLPFPFGALMNEDKGRQPCSVPDQIPLHTGLQHNQPWLHSAQAAGSWPGAPGSSRPDQCCLGGLKPASCGDGILWPWPSPPTAPARLEIPVFRVTEACWSISLSTNLRPALCLH